MKQKRRLTILFFLCLGAGFFFIVDQGLFSLGRAENNSPQKPSGFAGSRSCRGCHEKFYQLWAPSRHGLAMQPYTADFALKALGPQKKPIIIGRYQYQINCGSRQGVVLEKGPKGKKSYPIAYVLGGKNIYYFLTPLARGKLQTLPVAYDIKKKEWFDTAASGVRHFTGSDRDERLNWKEWPYTFNTACHGCHVSQFSSNYDLKTDTYKTHWTEPGINCETCHGPAEKHIQVCQQTSKARIPQDLKIIRGGRQFTSRQNYEACASCHAKSIPLTRTFQAGDRFFDSFDLVALESPDYYPDGRDLGENYTYSSWLLNPCLNAGGLDCLHCHTSSGRFRQKQEPNQACMPCHSDTVANPTAHTHHASGSPGSQCIACHMPRTEFARMDRSDHSHLPPTPAATLTFQSPNACNLCHRDKDALWADRFVRQWHNRDYQAPILFRAGLIEAARRQDRSRLPEILTYLQSPDQNPVFAASLIRLLRPSWGNLSVSALIKALKDPSPLVRSSAAEALGPTLSPRAAPGLLTALSDDYRLVRIRAAAALAGYPKNIDGETAKQFERADREYLEVILARPDLWTSHYNLGNYYLDKGEPKKALASYATALKLEPRSILPRVNAALAYARMGDDKKAGAALQEVLKRDPENGAANFNLGLLRGEHHDSKSAEKYLRRALKADPQMDQAAFNLCLVLAEDRLEEAIDFCRKANDLHPENPRYAYSLAFYLNKKGNADEAVRILRATLQTHPGYRDAALLLKKISDSTRPPDR